MIFSLSRISELRGTIVLVDVVCVCLFLSAHLWNIALPSVSHRQNPGIILPSANLDVTVKECVLGSLSFNGQRCTALKILFVHDSIADVFLAKFAAAVDALKLGLPWDPETKVRVSD